jgi:hypothetical protein
VNFNFVIMPTPAWYVQWLGPTATLVAALVGGWLAIRLQRLQAAIATSQIAVAQSAKGVAESQRDIALDKLKFDLFEKRYAIYSAAKRAIFEIVKMDRSRDEVIRENIEVTTESIFFFRAESVAAFESIKTRAYRFLEISAALEERDPPDVVGLRQQRSEIVGDLIQVFHKMPATFEAEFGFSQLTGRK